MYTVKGYVGSEEKLRTYFAGCAFEKKPRVLFVTDEVLPDHITCFEYPDSIRQTKSHKEPDDTLECGRRIGSWHRSRVSCNKKDRSFRLCGCPYLP